MLLPCGAGGQESPAPPPSRAPGNPPPPPPPPSLPLPWGWGEGLFSPAVCVKEPVVAWPRAGSVSG